MGSFPFRRRLGWVHLTLTDGERPGVAGETACREATPTACSRRSGQTPARGPSLAISGADARALGLNWLFSMAVEPRLASVLPVSMWRWSWLQSPTVQHALEVEGWRRQIFETSMEGKTTKFRPSYLPAGNGRLAGLRTLMTTSAPSWLARLESQRRARPAALQRRSHAAHALQKTVPETARSHHVLMLR